ncbi:MAG: hypothetical protein GX945_06150 [Lentisphaerae bacterium]|jgi:TolB protein|nr:hypothetical protein [Lentisphaerota bacterium]
MLSKLQITVAALLMSLALLAQTEQRTEVIKTVTDNPTAGVVSYEGNPAVGAKLKEMLIRSGWVRLLPDAQANQAMIKIRAKSYDVGGIHLQTQVDTSEKSFSTSQRGEQSSLVVFETVDEILRQLFKVPSFCTRKIAFVMPGRNNLKEIYSCYLDGSGQERITHNNAISTEPSWGHSRGLVYTLAKDNALSVVLVDLNRQRQRVVSRARGLNASAALSADGRRVALSMSRDNSVDLYVLDLATNELQRLSKDSHVESSPVWSPDGTQICYVSDRLGIPQLYTIDAKEGSTPKRLRLGGGEAVSPDWSPVSNRLCYATRQGSQYVISVLDMKDPNARPEVVTLAAGDWEAPSWGPDGRHLVCTRRSGRSRDLYLVDTWLKTFTAISEGANVSLPAWTPGF